MTEVDRPYPWDGIGTDVSDAQTVGDAVAKAGIGFQVKLVPAGFMPEGARKMVPVLNRRAVVDERTGAFIEFVSDQYPLRPYSEVFEPLDESETVYVAAGEIANGRQAFVVVQVRPFGTATISTGGRSSKQDVRNVYLVVRHSYDKSRGMEASILTVDPYTKGTLGINRAVGINRAAPTQHWSGDISPAALETRLGAYVDSFQQTGRALATTRLDTGDGERLLEKVLIDKPRRIRQISAILTGWEADPFAGTAWGLVRATNEFLMFGRSTGLRNDRSRFTDILTGTTYKVCNALVSHTL